MNIKFFMSTPSMLEAFFVGRALANALSEQVEHLVTDGLSQLGRFDAEQRENLRKFAEDVFERARQAEAQMSHLDASTTDTSSEDLQETIDNLRAEIAQVRASLQQYRHPA
jgi:uncharacterized membrane protein YccC